MTSIDKVGLLIEQLLAAVSEEAAEYAADAPEAIQRGERPDLWEREITIPVNWASEASALLQQQKEEIERLREALKPFADASRQFDDAAKAVVGELPKDGVRPRTHFTHKHLRAARAALEAQP